MNKKLKVAFAGFRHGHIYGLYAAVNQSEEAEFIGAWESFPEAKEQAEKRNITKWYASYEELLEDPEVDIVAIGDYYAARGNLAIKALECGKNIIADKPLCTSIEELNSIKHLAKEKNLSVGVMFDLRSNQNIYTAEKLIKSGEIGTVNNILFEGQHPLFYGSRPAWYFEHGKHGGVINDIAIHGIDLVRLFTGSNVKSIKGARCWNFYADKVPEFKDSAQIMLELESGAGVIGDVSYAVPDSFEFTLPCYWNFRIWGKKGMLEFNALNPEVRLYCNGEKECRVIKPETPPKTYFDMYLESVRANESAKSYYREDILNSCEQTLQVQRLADKNY